MQGRTRDYAERDNLDLPEVPRLKGDARHSVRLGMEGHETELPDEPIPADFVYRDQTPVLFGHYWMQGLPYILDPHASCLDFSVANDGCRNARTQSPAHGLRAQI